MSIDPLYAFNTQQIEDRINDTYDTVLSQVQKNQNNYVWNTIPSVTELGQLRMTAMNMFLADFNTGKHQHRYLSSELPFLPFANKTFNIALSSHFLLLYRAHLSLEFHQLAIAEMLRVAHDVRIFPTLTLNGNMSPYTEPLKTYFRQQGFSVKIQRVAYEFQHNGHEMLRITST